MKVLEGKNGWLFIDNDTNAVVDQHEGKIGFTPEQLDAWKAVLLRRLDIAASLGKPYYFLIAPDAHGIYPEFLPDSVVPAPRRPVHDLIDLFDQIGFRDFCYPLAALHDSKQVMQVGHQTDSHWSHYGAYSVYKELVAMIRRRQPQVPLLDIARVHFELTRSIGDLGTQLEPKRAGMTLFSRVLDPGGTKVDDNAITNRGSIQVFENRNKSLPTALMFRDSYGLWMRNFLAESFSRIIMVSTPLFETDMVKDENPDIIITEMAERFLLQVPDDENGDKVQDLIAAKMAAAG